MLLLDRKRMGEKKVGDGEDNNERRKRWWQHLAEAITFFRPNKYNNIRNAVRSK